MRVIFDKKEKIKKVIFHLRTVIWCIILCPLLLKPARLLKSDEKRPGYFPGSLITAFQSTELCPIGDCIRESVTEINKCLIHGGINKTSDILQTQIQWRFLDTGILDLIYNFTHVGSWEPNWWTVIISDRRVAEKATNHYLNQRSSWSWGDKEQ